MSRKKTKVSDFDDAIQQLKPSADEWETVSDDNGDRVEWTLIGRTEEGYFIDQRTIQLPKDQQKQLEDGTIQTEADMLVFEYENGDRWNSWLNYELAKTKFIPGDYYRITYKTDRKAKTGNVKIFQVQRRKTRVAEQSNLGI